MKKIKKTVLQDWSYLIWIALFGCVYMIVFGFPLNVGRIRANEPAFPPEVSSLETGSENGMAENADQGTEEIDEEAALAEDNMEQEDAAKDLAGDAGERVDSADSAGEAVYRDVTDDYFADAVFIGDSRTVGMYEYGGLEEISTFCCSTGLTVYKMFDAKIVTVPGKKEKLTVEELLSQRQFSSVYLMIGINEMGTGTVESFMSAYQSCVERLRELQPEAVIYLQGIIRVTSERSAQGDYITNEGIDARNEEIAKLADNESIFYLDVNPLLCDETGGMVESYTYDGVHLKAKYIAVWKEYLMSHVAAQRK